LKFKKIIFFFTIFILLFVNISLCGEIISIDPLDQVDQQQTDCTGGYGTNAPYLLAQSFKPSLNTLTRVEFGYGLEPTDNFDLICTIVNTIGGEILTQKTIHSNQIPPGEVKWLEFVFPDISVIPETTYYMFIEPVGNIDCELVWITKHGGQDVDPYPRGSIIFFESGEWHIDESHIISSAVHNWSNDGSFKVKLRVTDDEDDSETIIKTVLVGIENFPPIVDITNIEEDCILNGTVIIQGIADDQNGIDTLLSVEDKLDDNDWKVANGTVNWSYLWDTSLDDDGYHTIIVRSFDGQLYSDNISLNVIVINNISDIIIDEIKGRLGINVVLYNNGTATAYVTSWSIDVEGSIILRGESGNDILSELVAGESETIRHRVFGLGSVTITVTAGDATKQATAFVLGSLVLRVEET